MKDLRNLLIDCRIELRKLVRDFHKTTLCERLDAAVQQIGQESAPEQANKPNPTKPAVEKTQSPNQVALAWQAATRDLKFSDPALYDTLSKKVLQRLETKAMVDPATELLMLEKTVSQLKTRQQTMEIARLQVEAERDNLLGALADAVPNLDDSGDKIAVALARIDWLKSAQKSRPRSAAPTSHQTAVSSQQEPPEDAMPSDAILVAVAAGQRLFTDGQREWCVGEAMVLSGFQFTPLELIQQGDAQIAAIIGTARQL